MNKAFVREPDRTADYSPRCGSQGEPGGKETVSCHLAATSANRLSEPANFRPSPRCEVAYFDTLTVNREAVRLESRLFEHEKLLVG